MVASQHPLTQRLGSKSWSDVRALLRSTDLDRQIRFRESALHPDLYCLTYEQNSADWKNPFTRECRGIILDKSTNKIVCYPFSKFHNFGGFHAAKLDWTTAVFTEKLDGSLIKLYYLESEGNWDSGHQQHHGCQAQPRVLQQPKSTWPEFPYNQLDKRYTYLFELCHPESKIIVQHAEPQLPHLATRWTLMYEDADLTIPLKNAESFGYPHIHTTVPGIPAVQQVPIQNVESGQALLASGDWANHVRHEGIVATDAHFNRVKIKSPAYVGIAYALSHSSTGVRGLVVYIKNVVLKGEADEVAATMPGLARKLEVLNKVYDAYIADLVVRANQLQRDFALEEGKARKGKWAKACQAMPRFFFNPLLKCCDAEGPFNDAWFRPVLCQIYDSSSGKLVGDTVMQELVPQYANEDEVTLMAANLDADLRISGLHLTNEPCPAQHGCFCSSLVMCQR